MCDAPMALGNEEPTSYLLGIFIIKATLNSCACFCWDTQTCIQATGKRDVSSKWFGKYASELEQISQSNSTKTEAQQVVLSLSLSQAAAFGSGMHTSNIYFKAIPFWKRLSSLFDWQQLLVHQYIQLILSCQQINFICLCDQLLVHNSL